MTWKPAILDLYEIDKKQIENHEKECQKKQNKSI